MSASRAKVGGADLDSVNVLVVDEHPGMRMVWFALLHGFGIRRISQLDTLDGIETFLAERKIDIMILDYRISGGDAVKTVRALRMNPEDPLRFLPIIACTASTNPGVIWRLVEAGVDEILAKPVTIKEAARKMEAVINHRRPFVSTPAYFGPVYRKMPSEAMFARGMTLDEARARGQVTPAPNVGELRSMIAEQNRKKVAQALDLA